MTPTMWNRKRFDLLEVALVVLLATTIATAAIWHLARASRGSVIASAETFEFADRYGPDRHSQYGEEWLIRDFFSDRPGGFFVDVGASHYRDLSNTYYLETVLGWEGIAVEPLRQFAEDYARFRPRTRFRSFFVSDRSDESAVLYTLPDNSLVTSGRRDLTERYGPDVSTVTAPTITLDDLLTAEDVERFDFLSMDIELWEPKALAGFDIERFRPALVCIEGHQEVRQAILDYFARHNYVLIGRYLRADVWNLYFMPRDRV